MLKFAPVLSAFLLPLSAAAMELRVVHAETGRPIKGASVIFVGSTNTTDSAGRATGEGSKITARKSGYVPMTMSWEATAIPQRFELKLPPAETIGGRVVDRATNPVAGAVITVISPGPLAGPRFAGEQFPATSDAEGRWRCDLLPKDSAYVHLEFAHPNSIGQKRSSCRRFQMANSYDNVMGIFEVGRSLLVRAGRGWIGLMRDGYIFYLPSRQEKHAAIEVIKSRRAALK